MKLREFLQQQWFSRRKIIAAIDAGQIFLNEIKVESYWIDIQEGDEVVCEEKSWRCGTTPDQTDSHLLAFHKPIGYVCSKADPHNAIIYELLPKEYHGWYYIGRLDRESRGLVLMTNDPKMVDQYEHPRHGITKEYLVTLNKSFRKQDAETCLAGIHDQDEFLQCVECHPLDPTSYQKYEHYLLPNLVKSASCVMRIVLNEGKKRHIRRMMSTLRYHVEDLVRIREWKVELGDLKEGEIKIFS